MYENICEVCNPKEQKPKVTAWEDLYDAREEPSIYVGESSRSLAERAMDHWKDFLGGDKDSHMLKHWINHHGGEGEAKFRFRIVKFCRTSWKDRLERPPG